MQLMTDTQIVVAAPPITIPPEKTAKLQDKLLYHAKIKSYEATALLRKINAQEKKSVTAGTDAHFN